MIAWSKWNEFESGTSFGAWMSRIVRFTALNRSRKAATRRAQALAHPLELTTTASSIPPVLAGGALSIDQEAFDDHVVRALHQLQPEARTCLLLKVIADLDYREISTLLEMPEGTAMSHVSRARARMRELLTEAKEPQ